MDLKKPKVIAHRGGAGLAVENSLSAFENALNLRVDGIELDVHVLADGEVIVYHDFTLNPALTTYRDGRSIFGEPIILKSLTSKDLDQFCLMGGGKEKIPFLRDVLRLLKGRSQFLYIELKSLPMNAYSSDSIVLAKAVLKTIKEEKMENQVFILSFDWVGLKYFKKQAPKIPLIFVTDKDHTESGFLKKIVEEGGHVWSTNINSVNQSLVDEAHKMGLEVNVWTPNTYEDLHKTMDLGVDSISTDRPDLVLKDKQFLEFRVS